MWLENASSARKSRENSPLQCLGEGLGVGLDRTVSFNVDTLLGLIADAIAQLDQDDRQRDDDDDEHHAGG